MSNPLELRVTGAVHQGPVVVNAPRSEEIQGTNSLMLRVSAADDGGEANLTYTWSVLSRPTGAALPTFSAAANGSNAAKNITATFSRAGLYTFQVLVRDAAGLTTIRTLDATVVQTVNSIALTPASATVPTNGTMQFTASAKDQFGQPITQFTPQFECGR